VPVALAHVTLEYARQLDNSIKSHDTSDSSDEAKQLKDAVERLQIELGNLRAENEALRQEVTEVRAENQKWRDALAVGDQTITEAEDSANADYKLWEREFTEMETERDNLAQTLATAKQQYSTLLGTLKQELQEVRSQLETVQSENEALRTTQSAPVFELPEAPDLLNRLKAKRKKATASLADVEAILEILEG
jgi:regulator of replication initiation timing